MVLSKTIPITASWLPFVPWPQIYHAYPCASLVMSSFKDIYTVHHKSFCCGAHCKLRGLIQTSATLLAPGQQSTSCKSLSTPSFQQMLASIYQDKIIHHLIRQVGDDSSCGWKAAGKVAEDMNYVFIYNLANKQGAFTAAFHLWQCESELFSSTF